MQRDIVDSIIFNRRHCIRGEDALRRARIPAVRGPWRGRRARPPALRPSGPGHARGDAAERRGLGRRTLRADRGGARRDGAAHGRGPRRHGARARAGAPCLRRCRVHRRGIPAGDRRAWAADVGRNGGDGGVRFGLHAGGGLCLPHGRRRACHRGLRQRRATRAVPRTHARRALVRHDVSQRTPCGFVAAGCRNAGDPDG